MKTKLLFLFIITTQFLYSQSFTLAPPTPEFVQVKGTIAFSDVNGDGNDDVLISGWTGSQITFWRITKLYTNDGMGNFTEFTGTPFDGLAGSSIAFSDIDSDGDNDVLITGEKASGAFAKLYTNDGVGNFTEVTNTPFEGVYYSSIAFSDVNGDGSDDVLISGTKNSSGLELIAKLYTNDGEGNFTEVTNTPFEGVCYSSIAFSDVDGDSDYDVLITGTTDEYGDERIAKLFTNDGMGNFTEMTNTPFEGVHSSSIAFSDVNGDGNEDVLITGINDSEEQIAKLYTNDGMGNFTEITNTPFEGVSASSIAFSDVDGDSDVDVLITGTNSSGENTAKLYTNDGMGNFTEITNTPFEGVSASSIAFSDVNGDGDNDVLITGGTGPFLLDLITKLYTNDGMGNFTEMTGIPFEGIWNGSIASSDVNGDGNDDVLITGAKDPSMIHLISKLYTSDGMGNFTETTNTPFDAVCYSSIAFSDVDGDNDNDVLITGRNSSVQNIAKLYTNDGMGNFTEVTNTPFEGVWLSSISFSDVNGDGNDDVLITGMKDFSGNEPIAKLYTNDGMGNFTEIADTPFEGIFSGSIAFTDINGDNNNDVLITGTKDGVGNELIAKLYTNDGMGNFTEMTDTPFEGVVASSISFSDVDGDGNDDVLITGRNSSEENISKLYTNDGLGNFTEMTNTPFEGVAGSSIAFSDIDSDGDNDVLITGIIDAEEGIAKLYTNDGMGNFTEVTNTPFEGLTKSSIAFFDVNGDGYDDVLIAGRNNSGLQIAKLYFNDGIFSSTDDDLNIGVKPDIKLFPNPSTSNKLNLSYNSTEMGEVTLKVYNITGVLLSQQRAFTTIGQQTILIDIADLTRGNYFIELDNGKRKGAAIFVVQ